MPYPKNDDIILEGVQDYEETMEFLGGKHWRDISASDLVFNSEYIAYTEPVGFRFFLPAWLLACIQEDVDTDVLPEEMVWRLTIREPGQSADLKHARLLMLDSRQRLAVRHVLEYMKEGYPRCNAVDTKDAEAALRSLEDAGYI